MPFLKKLMYYLIGVGMGVLVVMFMFGDRDDIGCSYFPNDRVLSDLQKKQLVVGPDVERKMHLAGLDSADIQSMLLSGKVDFDKVVPGLDTCKTYWISLDKESSKPFSALWENCDSVATVLELKL